MKVRSLVKVFSVLFAVLPYIGYSQNPWLDSVKVAAKQQSDTTQVITLLLISESYQHYYPDSALSYAQRAFEKAERLQYDKGIFYSLINIHKALYALGNYALDIDYAFKAQAIGRRINSPFSLAWSNGMLGDCYYNLGEYDTALHYYRKVIRIAEVSVSPDLHAIYSNFTRVLIQLNRLDSALFYAKKGYNLYYETHPPDDKQDDHYSRSFMFRFLGDAYAASHLHDSALLYYRKSLPYSEDINLELNKLDVYNGIAFVHRQDHQPDSAVFYLNKVISNKKAETYPVAALLAAHTLTGIYEDLQMPDSTLKYLRIALGIKDSLFSRAKTVAVQNVFFKEQQKQKEILAEKEKLQDRYKIYLTAGLVLAIAIILTIVLRNRRINQVQRMRNQIANDLHDDIGSALSSISIMNELVKDKSREDALPLLNSIGQNTSSIQENMNDIIWAIQSGNDRFDNVFQRMNVFGSELLDAKNIRFNFASGPELSDSKLSMEQRKNFYFFFKEVITNSANHSAATVVSVRVTKEQRYVSMTIEDDGTGFDPTQQFHGNGMLSLKKRAADLKGVFEITSGAGKGTTVHLRFKMA